MEKSLNQLQNDLEEIISNIEVLKNYMDNDANFLAEPEYVQLLSEHQLKAMNNYRILLTTRITLSKN